MHYCHYLDISTLHNVNAITAIMLPQRGECNDTPRLSYCTMIGYDKQQCTTVFNIEWIMLNCRDMV